MKSILSIQRNIVIAILIITSIFLISWFLVYIPLKKSLFIAKTEAANLESRIKEIEKIVGKTKTIEASIKLLKARYQELNNKFFSKEEQNLKLLTEFAKKLNMEVVSIKHSPKTAFIDDMQKVTVDNRTLEVIAVSLQLRCLYKDLVRYIELLNKDLPAFVNVENLRIIREKPKVPILNVELGLNLYILS